MRDLLYTHWKIRPELYIMVILLAVVSWGDSLELYDTSVAYQYKESPYETYYFHFTAPAAGDYFVVLQSLKYATNYIVYYDGDSLFTTKAFESGGVGISGQYFLKFSTSAEGERHFFSVYRSGAGTTGGGFGICVRPAADIAVSYAGDNDTLFADTVYCVPDGIDLALSWNPPVQKKFLGWNCLSGKVTFNDSSNIRGLLKVRGDVALEALLSGVTINVMTMGTDTFSFVDDRYNGTPEDGVALRFDPPDTGRYAFHPWDYIKYKFTRSADSLSLRSSEVTPAHHQIDFTVTSVDSPVYLKVYEVQFNPDKPQRFAVTVGKPELQLTIDTTANVNITIKGMYTGITLDNFFIPGCPKPLQYNINKDYRMDSVVLITGTGEKTRQCFPTLSLVTLTDDATIKAYVSGRPVITLPDRWKIYDTYEFRYDNEAVVASFTPGVTDSFTVHAVFHGEEYGFIIKVPDVSREWTDDNAEGYSPLAYTFYGQADSICYFRIRTGMIKTDSLVALIVVKQGDPLPETPDLSGKTSTAAEYGQRLPMNGWWRVHASYERLTVLFSLDRSERIAFDLFEPRGRKTIPTTAVRFDPGIHRYEVPVHRLATGLYLLRISRTGSIQTHRIPLVR